MRSATALGLVGLLVATGCKPRPPEAPTELSDLAGFIFAHFDDEDPEELHAGVANLSLWLEDHYAETLEGYEVKNLDEEVVDALPQGGSDHLEQLSGASVGYQSAFEVQKIAKALSVAEQEEVFPDSYDLHERTFLSDKGCFLPKDCDFLETQNHVEASYGGLIKTVTDSRAEYRWLELEDGSWAFLHRTWLTQPAEVSMEGIDVHDQFYVGVTLPWEGGGLRLGTTWIAATILSGSVPESMALNMMISSMQAEGENLDAYLGAR